MMRRALGVTLVLVGLLLGTTALSAGADTIYPPPPPSETELPTPPPPSETEVPTSSPGATETEILPPAPSESPTSDVLPTEIVRPPAPAGEAAVRASVGPLPLTGVAVAGMLLMVVALLGAGVVLVRRSRGDGPPTDV